jgi:hypothetical protein
MNWEREAKTAFGAGEMANYSFINLAMQKLVEEHLK